MYRTQVFSTLNYSYHVIRTEATFNKNGMIKSKQETAIHKLWRESDTQFVCPYCLIQHSMGGAKGQSVLYLAGVLYGK